MRKDVFISYARSTNRQAAELLYAALGGETGIAFLDTKEIAHGDQFPKVLSDAILAARLFVAIVDDTYFSRWICLRELKTALAPFDSRLRSNNSVSIDPESILGHIVIAIPDSPSPNLLQNLPSAFQTRNWPRATDVDLLTNFINERLKALKITVQDRMDTTASEAVRESLLCETALPPAQRFTCPHFPHNFPPSLHERFVGRSDDIFRIHFVLSTLRGNKSQCAALSGSVEAGGGFGKTRIALEYAWRFGPAFYPGGIFWLTADQDESSLERQFHGMLQELKQRIPNFPAFRQQRRDARTELAVALDAAAAHGPVLFIIDNLPEPTADNPPRPLPAYCPAIDQVTLLVTTRKHIAEGFVQSLSIGVLPRTASTALLTEGTDARATLSDEQWGKVAEWVGDLPLALEVLNRALQFRSITATELLARSGSESVTKEITKQMEALRGQVPPGSLRGVTEALTISYESLSTTAKKAAQLLAWFSSEPIPIELFRALGSEVNQAAIRVELLNHSIVSTSGKTSHGTEHLGTIHRVMADYIRTRIRAPKIELLRICEAISSVMTESRCADPREWSLINACLPHADSVFWRATREHEPKIFTSSLGKLFARGMRGLQSDDTKLADSVVLIGVRATTTLQAQGQYLDARGYAEASYEFGSKSLGVENESTVLAGLALADVLRELGEPAGALNLTENAVAILKRICGDEHDLTIRAQTNLAATLSFMGLNERAVTILKKVLTVATVRYGEQHWETITAMYNLSYGIYYLGNREEAKALAEKAFLLYADVMGEDHPDTLEAWGNLINYEEDLNVRREMQERSLQREVSILGPEHSMPLRTEGNLANTLRELGEYTKARELEERVLEKQKAVLGEGHPETLETAHNLAITSRLLREYTRAREFDQWVLEKRKKVLGERHPKTLQTAHNLALTYAWLDLRKEERNLEEWVLEKRKKVLGEEHADTLQTAHNLGTTLRELREYTKARDLEEWVLEKRKKVLGEEHADTLKTAHNLALTYSWLGLRKGERNLEEWVLEKRKKVLGEEHADTLQIAHNLANTLRLMGKYTKARDLAEWVLEKRKKVLGDEHSRTLRTMYELGICEDWIGERLRARQLFERCLEMDRRAFGGTRLETFDTIMELGRTLNHLGEYRMELELLRPSVELCLATYGGEAKVTLGLQNRLGLALIALQRYEEARPILQKTLEERIRVLGVDHPHTAFSYFSNGCLSRELGNFDSAVHFFRKSLEVRLRELSRRDPETTLSAWELFRTIQTRDKEDARKLFDRNLRWIIKREPATLRADVRSLQDTIRKAAGAIQDPS